MGFALSPIQLISPAFENHSEIPRRFTGEGTDISPPLAWHDWPEGTRSFAIFCHDPDAPLIKPGAYGFVHWVLYNLPTTVTTLEENTQAGTRGTADFGKAGYGGPMPPEGHGIHHYYFWVLAIDREPNLEPGLPLWQFLQQVEPHVLGMNRLIGTYQRS